MQTYFLDGCYQKISQGAYHDCRNVNIRKLLPAISSASLNNIFPALILVQVDI